MSENGQTVLVHAGARTTLAADRRYRRQAAACLTACTCDTDRTPRRIDIAVIELDLPRPERNESNAEPSTGSTDEVADSEAPQSNTGQSLARSRSIYLRGGPANVPASIPPDVSSDRGGGRLEGSTMQAAGAMLDMSDYRPTAGISPPTPARPRTSIGVPSSAFRTPIVQDTPARPHTAQPTSSTSAPASKYRDMLRQRYGIPSDLVFNATLGSSPSGVGDLSALAHPLAQSTALPPPVTPAARISRIPSSVANSGLGRALPRRPSKRRRDESTEESTLSKGYGRSKDDLSISSTSQPGSRTSLPRTGVQVASSLPLPQTPNGLALEARIPATVVQPRNREPQPAPPSSPQVPSSPRIATSQIQQTPPIATQLEPRPATPARVVADQPLLHHTSSTVSADENSYLLAIPAAFRSSSSVLTYIDDAIDSDPPLMADFLIQIKKVPTPRHITLGRSPAREFDRGYWRIDPLEIGLTVDEFGKLWRKLQLMIHNAKLHYVSLQCTMEARPIVDSGGDGGGGHRDGSGGGKGGRTCIRLYSYAQAAMPLWCALTAYCRQVKTVRLEWRDATGRVAFRHP